MVYSVQPTSIFCKKDDTNQFSTKLFTVWNDNAKPAHENKDHFIKKLYKKWPYSLKFFQSKTLIKFFPAAIQTKQKKFLKKVTNTNSFNEDFEVNISARNALILIAP